MNSGKSTGLFKAFAKSAPPCPDRSDAHLISDLVVDLHQRLFWPDSHPTGIDRQQQQHQTNLASPSLPALAFSLLFRFQGARPLPTRDWLGDGTRLSPLQPRRRSLGPSNLLEGRVLNLAATKGNRQPGNPYFLDFSGFNDPEVSKPLLRNGFVSVTKEIEQVIPRLAFPQQHPPSMKQRDAIHLRVLIQLLSIGAHATLCE